MPGLRKAKVAIIGAGATGAFLSKFLSPYFQVDCFEKARGEGGRLSYRKTDEGVFIHGAQAFVSRNEAFLGFLQSYIDQGLISQWQPKIINMNTKKESFKRLWFEKRYTHQHSLAHFIKDVAQYDESYLKTRVEAIFTEANKMLTVKDDKNHIWKGYTHCFVTVPPVQAKQILNLPKDEKPVIKDIKSQYALMLSLKKNHPSQWQVAYIEDMFLKKIIRMKVLGKPSNNYILFSDEILNPKDKDKLSLIPEAFKRLKKEFLFLLEQTENDIVFEHPHFWRYRGTQLDSKKQFHKLDSKNIYICGDSFSPDQSIEGAFFSAKSVYEHMKIEGSIDV